MNTKTHIRNETDLRNSLGNIARSYSEGLRPETRMRILRSASQGLEAGNVRWSDYLSLLPQSLVAVAVVVVLLLPALQIHQNVAPSLAHPVSDLQVNAVGDEVVLTWRDGTQPRRVIRAVSREELPRLSQAAGVTVRGERWVDTQASEANIVYYLVE